MIQEIIIYLCLLLIESNNQIFIQLLSLIIIHIRIGIKIQIIEKQILTEVIFLKNKFGFQITFFVFLMF